MKTFLLNWATAILCLCAVNLAGQQLACSVVDGEGRPIPFVNVYAPASQLGMVTEEDGSFALNTGFEIGDTLRLSCLSYDDKYVAVADLNGGAACPIRLTQDAIELENILVLEKEITTYYDTLGYAADLPKAFYDFSVPGVENGIILRADGPVIVDRVDLSFGIVTMDTVFIELNFYELGADGEPTRYLQNQRIIHHLDGSQITGSHYSIDVRERRVRSDGPLLVTLKTLSAKGDENGKVWVAAEMTPDRALLRDVDGVWKRPGIHPLMRAFVRVVEE